MREVTPEPAERQFAGQVGSAVMRFNSDREPEVVLTISGVQVPPLPSEHLDRLVRELTSLNEQVQAYDKQHRRKPTPVAPDTNARESENRADALVAEGTK